MGPRRFRRGNAAPVGCGERRTVASMGPRRFRRGNSRSNAPGVPPGNPLQWGRDVSAAEMRVSRGEARRIPGASMGPRRFRRGNARSKGSGRSSRSSFNGAATFPPRKSTATIVYVPLCRASMGPRRFRRGNLQRAPAPAACLLRFNGAATFPPRKSSRRRRRLFGVRRFNGAATFPPRKSTIRNSPKPKRCSFNGAATFPPRKSAGTFTGLRLDPRLQWGRDVSAAEMVAPP